MKESEKLDLNIRMLMDSIRHLESRIVMLEQRQPGGYQTPIGCQCPPGSNMTCAASFCPRNPFPGVTC